MVYICYSIYFEVMYQGDGEFDTICGFYHPRKSLIYFSFHARSSFISTPFSKKETAMAFVTESIGIQINGFCSCIRGTGKLIHKEYPYKNDILQALIILRL